MAGPRHITVSEASRPVLPRHAKLKFDDTRKVWVILAPERVLAPAFLRISPSLQSDMGRS